MKNPAKTKKHWLVLLVVSLFIGGSIGGVTNLTGLYFAPMARDLDLLLGSISLHGTIVSFTVAFSSLTIPTAIDRLGFKKTILLGVIFTTFGTAAMSFTSNLWMIYLLGVIRGIGVGYYSYVMMSMILNRWFEQKIGLAIGVAAGFSGAVGAVMAPIFTSIINTYGWRTTFLVNALAILVLSLPAILYPLQLDPIDEGLLPYGHQKDKEREVIRRSEITEVPSTHFILLALMAIAFLNTFVIFMHSHLPGYGETLGFAPEITGLMLSATMVGNLTGKGIFGVLSDTIGAIKTSIIIMIIGLISIFMLIFLTHPALIIIGSFLFGFLFSIGGVAMPVLSNQFFGPVAGGNAYSKVNFLGSIGGALGISLTGYIYDFTGSYVPAFALGILFSLIDITLVLLAQKYYEKNRT